MPAAREKEVERDRIRPQRCRRDYAASECAMPSAHRVEGRADRAHLALARLVGLLLRGGRGRGFGGRLGSGAGNGVRGRAAGVGLDRFALCVEARLRQLLGPLLGDDDIAALHGLVGTLSLALTQRVGPGLAGRTALAGGIVLLAVAERVGQFGIGSAAGRDRACDVLAGIAMAVEGDLGGRAEAPAQLFVVGELARDGRIGDREVIAVAGSHAQRSVGAGERRIGRLRDTAPAEQVLEEAARSAVGILAILRAAIVLSKGHQDAAALSLAFAAVALQPLDLGQVAVEVRPHLLDLVVERTALRRLAAEQREKAAALAAQALRLLTETVELGLLLRRGVLVALDLVRPGGIDPDATIEGGELAFEPQAGLAASGILPGILGCGRRHAQNEDGQSDAQSAQRIRDACHSHKLEPDPQLTLDDGSGGMVTKVWKPWLVPAPRDGFSRPRRRDAAPVHQRAALRAMMASPLSSAAQPEAEFNPSARDRTLTFQLMVTYEL